MRTVTLAVTLETTNPLSSCEGIARQALTRFVSIEAAPLQAVTRLQPRPIGFGACSNPGCDANRNPSRDAGNDKFYVKLREYCATSPDKVYFDRGSPAAGRDEVSASSDRFWERAATRLSFEMNRRTTIMVVSQVRHKLGYCTICTNS